jgi:tetratricopeptide (TPR) repeat protein
MTKHQHIIACLLLAGAAAAGSTAVSAQGSQDSYAKGVQALEQGQPRVARIEFMNALQANPSDTRARMVLARTYLQLGDGVGAESELRRAREGGVPEAQTKHLLAHALLLQNHAQRAIQESAGAAPEHAGYAARVRGKAYMSLQDNGRASQEFAAAIAAAPNDGEVWTDVARFRRSTGELAGAIDAADRSVAINPRSIDALILRGELTRSQYGLAAAVPWFNRALELDPDNVTALLERATTFGDLGRMRAMLADSRRVLELSPANPVAYYLQAMLAARARDFPLARSIYQRTDGKLDEQPSGMLLSAAIDYQTGNVQQAVGRLERLVQQQPGNRKARRLLAASQWRLGDVPATIETLRPLADRPDADSYTLSLIGRALERQGDTAGAATYLARAAQPQQRSLTALDARNLSEQQFAAIRRVAEQRPNHAPTQIMLVAALLSRGLGDEALQRAREIQAANPSVPDAHVLVGDALGTRSDFAGAAQEYRKAANVAFTEPVALRLIEALQRSNQAPAAQQVLQLFVQQNPRNVPAQILVASAHMQAGDWNEAIRIYEGLRRRLGDRDASILNNLAWAYSERGDYARAVPLARRAWQLDRSNPATADTLGWILFKSGSNRAEGLALLEQALRGAPSDADIRRRLDEARAG